MVTLPSGVREGINIFLDGFIPTENMRFRETELSFKVTEQVQPTPQPHMISCMITQNCWLRHPSSHRRPQSTHLVL